MSNWKIRRASIAALLARLNTLSVSSAPEHRAEASAIQLETKRMSPNHSDRGSTKAQLRGDGIVG